MTDQILNRFVLLAASEQMHRVWGRFDHGRPGFSANQLLLAVAVCAMLILVAMAWRIATRRAARTFSSESPARLFRELCAEHGLSRGSRQLLKQLADARGLTNAAKLFVEPKHFDAKSLPAEMKPLLTELRQIRARMFE